MERKDKNQSEQRDLAMSAAAPMSAANLETTRQPDRYRSPGGHGFAAEDANNLADRWRGRDAEVIGGSNELRGPDRKVDGIFVQSKYYKTAAETMRSAFDPHGGSYRYGEQVLEVPKDQYEECLKLMEQRIREGRVPGHSDPADAKKLMKKGDVTWEQSRNIARAGNIDSVTFDIKSGAVVAGCTFGLSFMINYAQGCWRGLDHIDAFKAALQEALNSGLLAHVVHVASAQLLRSPAAAMGAVATRQGVRTIARTPLGRTCIEGIASASLGKAVHGAAAVNHVSKLLRSNVVTGAVNVILISVPDFYRALFAGSGSWQQFFKNAVVNIAGVAGGSGGALAGAAVGNAILPGVGAVIGGAVGFFAGNEVASQGAKSIADEIVEDDAIKLMRTLEEELQTLSFEYLLSEQEVEKVLYAVRCEIGPEWLRGMYQETHGDPADGRVFVRRKLEHQFIKIVKRRLPIHEASVQTELLLKQLHDSYLHDNDEFIKALKGLNQLSGKALPWDSIEEFDDFMLDDTLTLKL